MIPHRASAKQKADPYPLAEINSNCPITSLAHPYFPSHLISLPSVQLAFLSHSHDRHYVGWNVLAADAMTILRTHWILQNHAESLQLETRAFWVQRSIAQHHITGHRVSGNYRVGLVGLVLSTPCLLQGSPTSLTPLPEAVPCLCRPLLLYSTSVEGPAHVYGTFSSVACQNPMRRNNRNEPKDKYPCTFRRPRAKPISFDLRKPNQRVGIS
jgi:hypothetical protein